MKILKTTIALLIIMVVTTALSAPVGSRFSYQGQLQLNDVPANGEYDLKFETWSEETGGGVIGAALTLEDVDVDNGLFSVELDFGDVVFAGDDVFLKIQIREGTSTGSYTAMATRQRINAVPYAIQADFLAPGGATTGQILKFDGTSWSAANADTATTPWVDGFGGTQYIGDVIIGDLAATAGDTLQIVSEVDESPLRVQVGGLGTRFRVSKNGGASIGANYGDGDIPDNGLRVKGDVNVGDSTSPAKLTLSSSSGQNPLRVRVNGASKFVVQANGGTNLGGGSTLALDNGLDVDGETVLHSQTTITDDLIVSGDAKHSHTDSYGFVKAGIEFSCGFIGTTRLNYFNNINADEITVRNAVTVGACVVELPFSYENLYFQTTVAPNGNTVVAGSCLKGLTGSAGTTEVVICRLYDVENNTNLVTASHVTLLMF